MKRCAKAMAKAEWKSFVPQAEAHVMALMINQETAPTLEGKVKFKIKNHGEPS